MDANNSGFFANNWGNIASVVGLLVSALSVVFAKRASVAAKAARDAIFRRNIADDMGQANRVAAEMTSLVEARKFDAAISRCNELQDLSVFIQQRWKGQLTDSSKQRCLVAVAQLDGIHRVLGKLSKDPDAINTGASDRLIRSCRSVKLVFVEEQAIAIRTVDGGEYAG